MIDEDGNSSQKNEKSLSKEELEDLKKKNSIKKSLKPLLNSQTEVSKYNIQKRLEKDLDSSLNNTENTENQESVNLPSSFFSQEELDLVWENFIHSYRNESVLYGAISAFSLHKITNELVKVKYPSESAKSIFEPIRELFISYFKEKINTLNVRFEFELDLSLQQKFKSVSKKEIFDHYKTINPLIEKLQKVFKLDLS